MTHQYQIHHIKWNGIEIEVRYCPEWSQALQEGHWVLFVGRAITGGNFIILNQKLGDIGQIILDLCGKVGDVGFHGVLLSTLMFIFL